jgi:hypothetical protein
MVSAMFGLSANLEPIAAWKLYALVKPNAGATLLKYYVTVLTTTMLNALVGLVKVGTSGT